MSRHTPGPWEIGAEYMVCKLDELSVGSNYIRAKNDRESEEADARLIAAAPELLNALDEVTDFWAAGAEAPSTEELEPYMKIIAKAKGEQG